MGRKKKKLDHTWEELYKALKKILCFYNMAEVKIRIIHADNEFHGDFEEKVMDDLGTTLNFATPNEHILDIEHA